MNTKYTITHTKWYSMTMVPESSVKVLPSGNKSSFPVTPIYSNVLPAISLAVHQEIINLVSNQHKGLLVRSTKENETSAQFGYVRVI